MNYIIGLIGPSGSGKTTLIMHALEKLPDKTAMLISLSTRPRRSAEDDLVYRLISRQEYLRVRDAGLLATDIEYAGNLYGYEKSRISQGLDHQHLLCAVTEQAAQQLLTSGCPVKLLRIRPINQQSFRDQQRLAADQQRAQIQIAVDCEIDNSFEPGGLEQAVQDFCDFMSSLS
jgi:guanylate kinase